MTLRYSDDVFGKVIINHVTFFMRKENKKNIKKCMRTDLKSGLGFIGLAH